MQLLWNHFRFWVQSFVHQMNWNRQRSDHWYKLHQWSPKQHQFDLSGFEFWNWVQIVCSIPSRSTEFFWRSILFFDPVAPLSKDTMQQYRQDPKKANCVFSKFQTFYQNYWKFSNKTNFRSKKLNGRSTSGFKKTPLWGVFLTRCHPSKPKMTRSKLT